SLTKIRHTHTHRNRSRRKTRTRRTTIMSIVKRFITEAIKRTEIDEFLQKKLERAGYGGVNLSKTPLGTHVVVYAMRPGLVIGRGGETIKELATILEENFKISNPQISVSEIEVPEFNAYVVGCRVASALQRGVHFRRAGFWALNQVMDAGALGIEIVISGKLRTERARFEKFRAGYFPRCGEPALRYMKKAEIHVQLKPGIIGVRVKLMPPDAVFPDKIQIVSELPPSEETVEEAPQVKAAKVPQEQAEAKVEEKLEEIIEEKTAETVEEKAEKVAEAPPAKAAKVEKEVKEAAAKKWIGGIEVKQDEAAKVEQEVKAVTVEEKPVKVKEKIAEEKAAEKIEEKTEETGKTEEATK
ncbi:30S ribosomal protein S3, partial [Candidatus Bathyarchaeota archaeon]|nr:30S ribosomal protein S3 [Candidatus Bathyarchaeota archaeon]